MSSALCFDLSFVIPVCRVGGKTGIYNHRSGDGAAALGHFLGDLWLWVPDKRFALSGMTNRRGDGDNPAVAADA